MADLLVWWLGYGRSRWRDAAIAFAVPALFFGAYFATLAATAGVGWSIHLWLGAIVLAGVIGLLLDTLVHAATGRPAAQASR